VQPNKLIPLFPIANNTTPTKSTLITEDAELDEGLAERLRILADARALKSLAEAFLKPEVGVKTNGLMGRNYYDRPSAPVQMEDEDADEVVDILEDALMLKKAAAQW